MPGETIVAFDDSREVCVKEVMPTGHASIEDFTGGSQNVIVASCLAKDSGVRVYDISGEELPAGRPANAIPTHLLNDKHLVRVLGPGEVHEQPIIHKSRRAAQVIIMHHAS